MTKEAAFAEAYTAHYRQVRGLCRQLLGSTERAEDATQEAFVRAYRAFASYDPAQPFAGLDHEDRPQPLPRPAAPAQRRNARLFGDEAEEAAAAEAPGDDGLGAVLGAERAAAVNAAVAKLPERYRVPLALAYYARRGLRRDRHSARHHAHARRRAAVPRQTTAAPIARRRGHGCPR